MSLPLVTVAIGLYRYCVDENPTLLGLNSLALMLAAGSYFYFGVERKRKWPVVLAAAIANVALSLLWLELSWSDPQFFMIPLGVSILLLVELLRAEIPAEMRNPLRYVGALVILVSPMFHVFDGSWLHLLTWMIASVGVLLLAIGLRVRVLVYTGTAFLVADLVGMVVRGSVDHPNLLWLAGIVFGAAVVTLGAICENNRERVLQRMRTVSARLATWN